MKKHLITLVSLMLSITLFGQDWIENRSDIYAAAAKKEFSLNDEQAAKIKDLWIERLEAFNEANDQLKSGAITSDEKLNKDREIGQAYATKMMKVLGCNQQEFWKFNAQAQEKLSSQG